MDTILRYSDPPTFVCTSLGCLQFSHLSGHYRRLYLAGWYLKIVLSTCNHIRTCVFLHTKKLSDSKKNSWMYFQLIIKFGWFCFWTLCGFIGVPLIPTVITVIVAYAMEKDYFIMTTRCQWLWVCMVESPCLCVMMVFCFTFLSRCWLSQENYFIWAFIAPMLLIILVGVAQVCVCLFTCVWHCVCVVQV